VHSLSKSKDSGGGSAQTKASAGTSPATPGHPGSGNPPNE
jgi:hypothetical protein